MLMKICKCGRKLKQEEKCECEKKRYKKYNEEYRDRIKATFYGSESWRKLSEKVKARATGLDEYVLKYESRIEKGKIAHHIIEFEENEEMSMKEENLIYVSERTHAMIHSEYKKSEKSKIEMQKKLISIRENK